MALVHQRQTCSQAHLARLQLQLAEITIDERNLSSTEYIENLVAMWFDGLDIYDVSNEVPTVRAHLEGCLLWPIGFSPDSKYFTFARIDDQQLTLSWVDCEQGRISSAPTVPVSGALIGARTPLATWMGPHALVCRTLPTTGAAAGCRPPSTCDTPSDRAFPGTVDRRLLQGHDQALLRTVLSTRLTAIDLQTENVGSDGVVDLHERVSGSPDGRYLLVTKIAPIFDECATFAELPRVIGLHASSGRLIAALDDGGIVPTRVGKEAARRSWSWHPFEPSTMIAVSRVQGEIRVIARDVDENRTKELFRTAGSISRLAWTTRGTLLVWQKPAGQSRQCLMKVDAASGESRRLDACARLMERAELTDGQGERPVWSDQTDHAFAIETTGGIVFVDGDCNEDGEDTLCVFEVASDGETRRIIAESRRPYEQTMAMLDEAGVRRVVLVESPEMPPRYEIVNALSGSRVSVTTSAAAPSPESMARRKLVAYPARKDATGLATVYLPEKRSALASMPCIIWVHPHAAEAPSQGRYLPRLNRYLRTDPLSPLLFLAHGYAVVIGRIMPISTAQRTSRRNVVDQMVANVDGLMRMLAGFAEIDVSRSIVMGTCLGAWAATVLLANTDRFCAGIARSGFFNAGARSVQWWFAGENVTLAEFKRASPILSAEAIKRPLLIVHGEREGPPVNAAAESRALFAQMATCGGRARYVNLPYEGHWCCSVEGIRSLIDETVAWCNRFAVVTTDKVERAG